MSRTVLSSHQLYAIFEREYRKIRPTGCKLCRLPLPYYRAPPDDVSANWAVGTPQQCPANCHLVIAELVTRLWSRYDMEPERPQ